MTSIASWFDLRRPQYPSIWTVGDTMISDPHSGKTYTLRGAKVLELPIRCKRMDSPAQPVYYTGQLGFAYAGSSLNAMNCYATLSAFLTNLGSSDDSLPDHINILHLAKKVLKSYVMDWASVCELVIYGVCPLSRQLFMGSLRPQQNEDPYAINIEYPKNNELSYMLLGDSKEEISALIDKELDKHSDKKGAGYWHAPIRIIEKLVENNTFNTIGGGLQLNILNRYRFDLMFSSSPRQENRVKFRDIDLFSEVGIKVGDCFLALNGMAHSQGLDEEGFDIEDWPNNIT